MLKATLLICIACLFVISCKKNKESCWQVYDLMGVEMGVVCGKTESQIQAQYGPFYDRANAPKFCWKIVAPDGSLQYPENLSEKMVVIWFPNAVSKEKIACGYCEGWLTREKWVKKQTGQFAYTQVRGQMYCG